MQKQMLEAALCRHAQSDDPVVVDRLAYLGAALRKTCELASALPVGELPSKDRLEEALANPEAWLLRDHPVKIDPVRFEEIVREMAVTLHDASRAEGALSDAMRTVDWTGFTTPELVKIAESAPCDYFDHVAKAAQPDDLLDFYILPVLGYSLRTFLDGFAEQASRAITKYDDVTVRDRPLRCPVCGGTPDFAAVYATARNGNVKHLYCGVCGANWKFERIRCAACGSSVVSDLSYVHEEKDPSRRLHVCKACGEAVPTFFAPGGEESFSPEIERILVTGLEAAYAEERVN